MSEAGTEAEAPSIFSENTSESSHSKSKTHDVGVPQSLCSSTDDDEEDIQADEPEKEVKEEEYETVVEKIQKQGTEDTLVINKVKMTDQPPASPQPFIPRRKRFIPNYEVEGVHKVILTEDQQIAIDMLVGPHVNAQFPWKKTSKDKILENIRIEGELSPFTKFQQEIEQYPTDEILMGYVPDESNDFDEFYICVTQAAKDHCKKQSDRFLSRQERKLLKRVQKKARPWTSLGSEIEITELAPVNARPLMEIEIKTKFPTVYQPTSLKVRDTNSCRDGYVELTPYRQKFFNVFRRRIDTGSQIVPSKKDNIAQTVLRYPQNMWTQSVADAMGAIGEEEDEDIDSDASSSFAGGRKKKAIDEVARSAFNRAMARLRRPSYCALLNDFMTGNAAEMQSILELNALMDIYGNDYPQLVRGKIASIYDTMSFEEYVCFTDIRAKNKFVSCATFHPMWAGILAISYADASNSVLKHVSSMPDPINRAVYGLNPVMIWSHIDSLIPKLYLESTREVKCLSFCPYDENLLIGGCVNGQIVLWDLTNKLENVETIVVLSETREKYRIAMNAHMTWMKNVHDDAVVTATAVSNLQTSHFGPVTSIQWLSPSYKVTNTGRQMMFQQPGADEEPSVPTFFSTSEDGTVLIWNLSVENIALVEKKKVKKSKRILRRPSGLVSDLSPYKLLDRILQPSFKLIIGTAGKPQLAPIQHFIIFDTPLVEYTYVPRNDGGGRKYFVPEIKEQAEEDMRKLIVCGSMHGVFLNITWEGHDFNTGELVNSEYCHILYNCSIHNGVITAVKRNPFIKHLILSVGGKIFALWSSKLQGRPVLWKKRPVRLTDAEWSNYKPSIVFITTADGSIEVWDFLLRSDQPVSIQSLSGTTLTGVTIHALPLKKNIIGVSDYNGSFKMYMDPPIFMIHKQSYIYRYTELIERELTVMHSFLKWQEEWKKMNPEVFLERKRKEGILLAEQELERVRQRELETEKLEAEAEERRLAQYKTCGPAERWERIVQKLIERTIAVKKSINRAELIENEKPLRELDLQKKEKEERMLGIMKNQKNIFNDTVAILFPEAIKKEMQVKKKSIFHDTRSEMKENFLEEYSMLKCNAFRTIDHHPFKATYTWPETLAEGKTRRQALHPYEDFVMIHKMRLKDEGYTDAPVVVKQQVQIQRPEPIGAEDDDKGNTA